MDRQGPIRRASHLDGSWDEENLVGGLTGTGTCQWYENLSRWVRNLGMSPYFLDCANLVGRQRESDTTRSIILLQDF